MNSVCIIGRLSKDPELKHTQSGIPVSWFSLAVDRGYGEKRATDWFDCVMWRSAAEALCQYSRKGDRIAVRGHLQTNSWEDKQGNKRIKVEIVADEFFFLTRKRDGARETEAPGGWTNAPLQETPNGFLDDDGDIPF